MHRAWVGIGLLILVAGLVIGVLGNVQTNSGGVTGTHPSSNYTASELLLGTGTISLTWSQAPANASFVLYRCSSSACTSLQTVATGNGSKGSFSSSATSGETFQVALTGPEPLRSNATATIAWTESGFTYYALSGIVLSIGGVAIIVFVIRRS